MYTHLLFTVSHCNLYVRSPKDVYTLLWVLQAFDDKQRLLVDIGNPSNLNVINSTYSLSLRMFLSAYFRMAIASY